MTERDGEREDTERTLAAPNFDAGAVRGAQPAVLLERDEARRGGQLPWVVVALVAGMIGGLLGLWALSYYQKADDGGSQSAASVEAGTSDSPAATPPANVGDGGTQGAAPQPSATAQAEAATPQPAEAGDVPSQPLAQAEELRGALAGWIDATNARDLDRQMDFYDSRVSTFYLERNASRDSVRAEKSNAFAGATTVAVSAGQPQISLGPDGRTATMRFRKQYAVMGGGQDRRGAVLQELRWRRTPRGWKIVGERDLRVVD